jgi:hypothetical protein
MQIGRLIGNKRKHNHTVPGTRTPNLLRKQRNKGRQERHKTHWSHRSTQTRRRTANPDWDDAATIARGIATFDQKGVAPQKPQETIAAYVTRVQISVATTSGEAIAYTGNFVKDSNTPRWNNRTAKYLAAQTVFNKRAVERPWTDRELAKINSRNNEYGREQQQAARYECRHIMTAVVTCEIVKNGLSNPVCAK